MLYFYIIYVSGTCYRRWERSRCHSIQSQLKHLQTAWFPHLKIPTLILRCKVKSCKIDVRSKKNVLKASTWHLQRFRSKKGGAVYILINCLSFHCVSLFYYLCFLFLLSDKLNNTDLYIALYLVCDVCFICLFLFLGMYSFFSVFVVVVLLNVVIL